MYLADEEELINYRLFLLGYNVEGLGRLETANGARLPLLATPFRRHLNEVNRFLFDGGVVVDTRQPGPKQDWVTELAARLKLGSVLDSLWEKLAVYGRVLLGLHPDGEGFYRWAIYTNYELEHDTNGNIVHASAFTTDDQGTVWRTVYTPKEYQVYPARRLNERERNPNRIKHSYPFAPVCELRNNSLGISEFDIAAIEMATEIAVQYSAAAENFYYFGNQIITTPNKRETLDAIATRSRVLTQESEAEGGRPSVLDLKATPEHALKLIENINANLADHLGSPIVHLNLRSDLSSLTLKLTHQGTIGTAQRKWESIITEGVKPTFGRMLLMAAYDGLRSDVTSTDSASYNVDIMRTRPYFQESALEKSQRLVVVDSLISLGIRPSYALAEEYYTHLTEAQVEDLLNPGPPVPPQ